METTETSGKSPPRPAEPPSIPFWTLFFGVDANRHAEGRREATPKRPPKLGNGGEIFPRSPSALLRFWGVKIAFCLPFGEIQFGIGAGEAGFNEGFIYRGGNAAAEAKPSPSPRGWDAI